MPPVIHLQRKNCVNPSFQFKQHCEVSSVKFLGQKFESLTPPRPFLLLPISTPFEHDTRTGPLDCNHNARLKTKIVSIPSLCFRNFNSKTPRQESILHENNMKTPTHIPQTTKSFQFPLNFQNSHLLNPKRLNHSSTRTEQLENHERINFLSTHRPNMSFNVLCRGCVLINNPLETSDKGFFSRF